MNGSPTANLLRLPPSGGGSLFAFGNRLTRKRVFEFLEAHLLTCDVLLELVAYIFFYRLFVTPHCIYIVPPAPEIPTAILVLEIRMAVEYHDAAFSLEIGHNP